MTRPTTCSNKEEQNESEKEQHRLPFVAHHGSLSSFSRFHPCNLPWSKDVQEGGGDHAQHAHPEDRQKDDAGAARVAEVHERLEVPLVLGQQGREEAARRLHAGRKDGELHEAA